MGVLNVNFGPDGSAQVPAGALRFDAGPGTCSIFGEAQATGGEFRLVVASGKVLDHPFWGRIAFDLQGIKPAKGEWPVLREHLRDRVVGMANRHSIERDGWVNYGKFSESTKDAAEVRALAREGFPWQASMSARPRRVEQLAKDAEAVVNGQSIQGPAMIWREAEVSEASWCVLGADSNTSGEALSGRSEMVTLAGEVFSSAGQEVTRVAARMTSAEAEWEAAVTARIEGTGCTRGEAIRAVVAAQPTLHRNYLAAVNEPAAGFDPLEAKRRPEAVERFNARVAELRKEHNWSAAEAMREIAAQEPDLQSAYVEHYTAVANERAQIREALHKPVS